MDSSEQWKYAFFFSFFSS